MINTLMLGKSVAATGKTAALPVVGWLAELQIRNACALIDLTQVGDAYNSFSVKLTTELEEAGIAYLDLANGIPDSELVRDAFFDELFTAEEKLLYQVPVRFGQFCLHELPIAIYNFALRYPDRPVALLLEQAELSDKLRIHFSRSVANGGIQGIGIDHLFPVMPAGEAGPLSYLQIPNESLTPYWRSDYEEIITAHPFRTSLNANVTVRPLNTNDLVFFRPTVKDTAVPALPPPRSLPKYYFMLNYVPFNRGGGELSNRIIGFKNGVPEIVEDFTAGLIKALGQRALPIACVIRALGSSEITAGSNRPLDRVGQAIAEALGFPYRPELISKTRATTPLKTLTSAAARDLELQGIYQTNSTEIDYNGGAILVLDDIYTRGTTFKAIEQSLLAKWPQAKVFGHFLARTI